MHLRMRSHRPNVSHFTFKWLDFTPDVSFSTARVLAWYSDHSRVQPVKSTAVTWNTTHLQCTTMGPAYDGFTCFTFFRNFSMPMGEKGTPKSGQLVKWSCVTRRGVLVPSLACCGGHRDGWECGDTGNNTHIHTQTKQTVDKPQTQN